MGQDNKILDDIARVAGGAVNLASGLHQQIREDIKTRVEEMADHMDLVPRQDLEDALARINKLDARIKDLEQRLNEIEKK